MNDAFSLPTSNQEMTCPDTPMEWSHISLYLPGFWLIGTGAAHSILSFRVYNSLPTSVDFSLSSGNSAIALVDGQQVKSSVIHVVLCLGNSEFQMHVIVAEVEDEGILGMEFLSQVDSCIDIVKITCPLMVMCLIVLISRTNPLVPEIWFYGEP